MFPLHNPALQHDYGCWQHLTLYTLYIGNGHLHILPPLLNPHLFIFNLLPLKFALMIWASRLCGKKKKIKEGQEAQSRNKAIRTCHLTGEHSVPNVFAFPACFLTTAFKGELPLMFCLLMTAGDILKLKVLTGC